MQGAVARDHVDCRRVIGIGNRLGANRRVEREFEEDVARRRIDRAHRTVSVDGHQVATRDLAARPIVTRIVSARARPPHCARAQINAEECPRFARCGRGAEISVPPRYGERGKRLLPLRQGIGEGDRRKRIGSDHLKTPVVERNDDESIAVYHARSRVDRGCKQSASKAGTRCRIVDAELVPDRDEQPPVCDDRIACVHGRGDVATHVDAPSELSPFRGRPAVLNSPRGEPFPFRLPAARTPAQARFAQRQLVRAPHR